jgi:folate-binding protein YgfZ
VPSPLLLLPLNDAHQAEGAVFGESSGWLVPLRYGDPMAEHRAVMGATGLLDRSMVGKVVVTGRDRATFLQGMLSNDIKALQPGQGCPAAFLDAHGKVVSLLAVYVLEDRILLELPAGSTDKFLQTIDKFLISEKAYFEASDDGYVVLSVQGPGAEKTLAGLAAAPLAAEPYSHQEASIAGEPVRIVRRSHAASPGFDCWAAAAHGPALWKALREAGGAPVGAEAAEVLRVEAGIPAFGADVDENLILPETRLDQLVSYTKGCYIGQETVARVKYRGHVNRGLSGLVVEGKEVPTSGDVVLAEDKEVGRVTSAVHSIALGKPIALGYVRREHFEPGSAVAVRVRDQLVPARVVELPFVKSAA